MKSLDRSPKLVEVRHPDELHFWLKDKPMEWSQAIATRTALRVIPQALEFSSRRPETREHLSYFRSALVSWANCNYPAYSMDSAANLAANSLGSSNSITYAVRIASKQYSSTASNAADGAAHAANLADEVATNSAMDREYSKDVHADGKAQRAMDAASNDIWRAISEDLNWLKLRKLPFNRARGLVNRTLWPKKVPMHGRVEWQYVCNKLLSNEHGFEFWIDWFERRVKGERSAFDIPGDKHRREDKWLLRKIADATNEDFWDLGAGHVNETLTSWLEEARERAASNLDDTVELTDAFGKPLGRILPVEAPTFPDQSKTGLRFGQDDNGRVTLAPETNLGDLKTDADARDRHELALEDAKALLAACEGSNSAERLSSILTAYIKAAGESLETIRPSAYVQRGERLRQELAKYEAPDTDLPPLSDAIITDLGSVCKAHNMVVGLDPVLLDLDTAQLGPDREIGDATPAEVREVTKEADEAQILALEVPEMMFEAVDLVPEGAGPEDRRFRWCMESGRNLIIEAFALALNHPIKTTAGMAGTVTIGPPVLVGSALGSAQFLLDRRDWIEEKLGRHAPTWTDLFAHLCDLLEETKNKRSED